MKNLYKYLSLVVALIFLTNCTKEDDKDLIIIEHSPSVEFSYSPEQIRVGQEVSFSARFLTGSSVITSWKWSFGDQENSTSNKQNEVFTYQEEGVYTVSLTVTDEEEKNETITQEITVLEALEGALEATIVWSFNEGTTVSNANDGSSAPAIDDNGVVYYLESYAGANSKLIAVNDLGTSATKKWDASLGYNLRNAPAIDGDGNIYIGAWSLNALVKVNAADGNQLWQGTTGSGISNSTTAIDNNGNTYVGTRSAGIQSWDTNGSLRWAYNSPVSGARYYASPVLSKDGNTLYILMTGGEMFAINTNDGSLKWSEVVTFSGDATGTSFSIDNNGVVYFTTTQEVVAVTDNGATGEVKWRYQFEGANSSGVVIGNENVYVGGLSGLVALSIVDGNEVWNYDSVAVEESVPAVDSDENIYVGTNTGKLIIVSNEGELLKEMNLSNGMVHSPTIADDGAVYIEAYGDNEITLHKIEISTSEGPLNSKWAMKGKNRMNTSF